MPRIYRLSLGDEDFFDDATFDQDEVELEPGDHLFVYTDGVTEAMDPDGEELGEPQLIESLLAARENGARQMIELVLEAVRAHAKGVAQSDDVTIVSVKREPK